MVNFSDKVRWQTLEALFPRCICTYRLVLTTNKHFYLLGHLQYDSGVSVDVLSLLEVDLPIREKGCPFTVLYIRWWHPDEKLNSSLLAHSSTLVIFCELEKINVGPCGRAQPQQQANGSLAKSDFSKILLHWRVSFSLSVTIEWLTPLYTKWGGDWWGDVNLRGMEIIRKPRGEERLTYTNMGAFMLETNQKVRWSR